MDAEILQDLALAQHAVERIGRRLVMPDSGGQGIVWHRGGTFSEARRDMTKTPSARCVSALRAFGTLCAREAGR
jgi:hypothetical protein